MNLLNLLHKQKHQYHQNKLSSKYISFLQSGIDDGLIKPEMGKIEEIGVGSYLRQLKINCFVRRYRLRSRMNRAKKMRYNITNFLRALFCVPHEEPLRVILKRKMKGWL